MNYANIFEAICFKTQPKYANICFKTQGKVSVACRILLLLEKTPLKEHLLAQADTLPKQAKWGNFVIISSFCLIFYTLFAGFLAYKITTFPLTHQIIPHIFYIYPPIFYIKPTFSQQKRQLPALIPFALRLPMPKIFFLFCPLMQRAAFFWAKTKSIFELT